MAAPGTEGFLGNWLSVSGARTLTCPGQPPQTTDVTGTVTVLPGSDSPLLLRPAGSDCALPLDFSMPPAGVVALTANWKRLVVEKSRRSTVRLS